MKFFILSLCLTLTGLLQARELKGQDLTRVYVSLRLKNSDLKDAFKQIETTTSYRFTYKSADVAKYRHFSYSASNVSLDKVLRELLKSTDLGFEQVDKAIIIKKSAETVQDDHVVPAAVLGSVTPINVSGKVTDSLGAPLIGASIWVKDSPLATVTDNSGFFKLVNVPEDAVITVTYIGYQTKAVSLKNIAGPLTIVLIANSNALNEVVVSTGYQKLKPYQLTGAASVLSEKDYDQRVAITGDFLESLEGKIPGLVYNPQTRTLSIRGVSTFNAVNQPLIVVDGFPTNIDLSTINPNDVVSVTVLKDAAAAAIYGVRASNGVIVLETKRGKSGKTIVNVRVTTAAQAKPDFSYLKYAPANEYAQLETDVITAAKSSSTLWLYNAYLGSPLDAVQDVRVKQYLGTITAAQASEQITAIGSYDNLKEYRNLFYRNHLTNNVNVDASGGGSKSTYLLGLNYIGDKLTQQRADNRRFLVNLANTFELNKRMKLDFKTTYSNAVNTSGNIPDYSTFLPYEHLADGSGNALPVALGTLGNGTSNYINAITNDNNTASMAQGLYDSRYYPYRELSANTNTTKLSSIQFAGRLNTRLTGWLTFDLGGNYENQNNLTDNLMGEESYNTRLLLNLSAGQNTATGKAVYNTIPQGDILMRNTQNIIAYTVRGQFNINKSWQNNIHEFSAIIGAEQRKTTSDTYLTTFFGYDGQTLLSKPYDLLALNGLGISSGYFYTLNPLIPYSGNSSNNYFSNSSGDSRFMSYYGDGTYTFKGKYIATGSIRLDQSNLFGTDPKYRDRPLWSAGLAWRMDQENFIRPIRWINELKLRAATGFTGNIPSSNNGKYLLLSSAINTNLPTALTYYTVSNPQNESLRWETTKNYNLGLDYGLFNSRLTGSIDYYVKNSVDLYGSYGADPTLGFNSYNANTASMINKGLEIAVNTVNIQTRHFSWQTGLTASFNHNEVTAIKATSFSGSTNYVTGTQLIVGQPMRALYSYNYGGLTALGQPYVLTNSGSKVILNGTTSDVVQSDLIYNGTTTPKYVLGLNNQFTIGAFDVSFLWMYYGGHVMRVQPPIAGAILESIPLQGASAYWKNPGDELITQIPRLPLGSTSTAGYYSPYATWGYLYASQFVRKADYIKLRDLIVTYNLKSKALERLGIVQPQIRLQAQNAFRYTFSGNDIDPEAIDPVGGTRTLQTQPYYSVSLFFKF